MRLGLLFMFGVRVFASGLGLALGFRLSGMARVTVTVRVRD